MSQRKTQSRKGSKKVVATRSSTETPTVSAGKINFLFGKRNFIILVCGVILIALGMLLMSGGSMPDPNTWDESIIYSTRRTLLAPIVILAGLGLQVYAIFAKK